MSKLLFTTVIVCIMSSSVYGISFSLACTPCTSQCSFSSCFKMTNADSGYQREICGPVSCTNSMVANSPVNLVSCGRDFSGSVCPTGVCVIKPGTDGCEQQYESTSKCDTTGEAVSVTCEQCSKSTQCTKCIKYTDSADSTDMQSCIGTYCPQEVLDLKLKQSACPTKLTRSGKTCSSSCCYQVSYIGASSTELKTCTQDMGILQDGDLNHFVRQQTKWGWANFENKTNIITLMFIAMCLILGL